MKYLGKHFDIHTGGVDHVPVHHTNEIAQSEGSFDEAERAKGPWVNYWLHNEFLILEGGKMSKSNGKFITLQTNPGEGKGFALIEKGYEPLDYRYFLLGGHYRKPLVFSFDGMDSAKNGRASLIQKIVKLAAKGNIALTGSKKFGKGEADKRDGLSEKANQYLDAFKAGLENDLMTPVALSQISKVLKDSSLDPKEALDLIDRMDSVISLSLLDSAAKAQKEAEEAAKKAIPDHSGDSEAAEIDALVAERTQAKKDKNFARADEIRNLLSAKGISIIDTPNGPTWKRN